MSVQSEPIEEWSLDQVRLGTPQERKPLHGGFVFLLYSFPRTLANLAGVLALSGIPLILCFGPYFQVGTNSALGILVLGVVLAAAVLGRTSLSSRLRSVFKRAAEAHFSHTVTSFDQGFGAPADSNRVDVARADTGRKIPPEKLKSVIREPSIRRPDEILDSITDIGGADVVIRAHRHLLAFLEVVIRAKDRYVLTPPTIRVETQDTRRIKEKSAAKPRPKRCLAKPPEDPAVPTDVVPLRWVEKGFILNDFTATINGEDVDLLGTVEAHAISMLAVEVQWIKAFGHVDEDLRAKANDMIVSPIAPPLDTISGLVKRIRTLGGSQQPSDETAKHVEVLCTLVYQLARQRIIYGVTEQLENKDLITVGTSWSIKAGVVRGRWTQPGRVAEWLRSLLNVPPRLYLMKLFSVTRADSYHLEVEIPEGMYYYKGLAIIGGAEVPSDNASFIGKRVHHAHSSSIGTSLVHETYKDVAARAAPKATSISGAKMSEEEAYFALHVREVPPASGLVLILGALATLLLVSYMTTIDVPGTPTSGDPAIPAILASLPAILAGWMVSRLTNESLGRMSIASACNVLWYLGNALSTALLPSTLSRPAAQQAVDFWILHTDSVAVACLCLSVCANLFSIIWHFVLRSRRYSARLAAW